MGLFPNFLSNLLQLVQHLKLTFGKDGPSGRDRKFGLGANKTVPSLRGLIKSFWKHLRSFQCRYCLIKYQFVPPLWTADFQGFIMHHTFLFQGQGEASTVTKRSAAILTTGHSQSAGTRWISRSRLSHLHPAKVFLCVHKTPEIWKQFCWNRLEMKRISQ